MAMVSDPHVTVRVADERDTPTLRRLAALDSAAVPVGTTLVAEIDGEAAAALPVAGGAAIADPFRRTSAAVELLELRAAQIRGKGPRSTSPPSYGERLRALVRTPRAAPLR
jgi:hypothetical protein